MNFKRLAVIGLSGRMGREIHTLSNEFGFKTTTGVASRVDSIEDIPIVSSPRDLDANSIDIVIDFSLPELTLDVVDWCRSNKKPLVSGVTGISDEQKRNLYQASSEIPVLWAPNMSLGVAVLARMLSQLSHLEGFDFQIEEFHHNKKKDKPSGTALFLQEKLKAAVTAEVPEALAIRGGGIFGVHKIWAMGEEETVMLEHTAMNRRVFARGALRAAKWLLSQAPGQYKIDDVLGK